MNWTSIYLKTENSNVFILGTGEVAIRRAHKFLDHGANVILFGDYLDNELRDKGALLRDDNIEDLIKWADVVVIATGDRGLSDYVANLSKDKLLNRADFPDDGNIVVPNSFNVGDVEISIFTGSKSPLVSKYLRRKIESIITAEDIERIKLQDYSRKRLKECVESQKSRKEYLYQLFKDEKIEDLVKKGNTEEAKICIDKFIDNL